eukprot:GEMP01025756.1.p1 GENE.GEMP01025756.1~~GEMP01025756.1.p1  ORF type:complete len:520 (+),score=113.22 GEMP01025756.1:190-1749(+)
MKLPSLLLAFTSAFAKEVDDSVCASDGLCVGQLRPVMKTMSIVIPCANEGEFAAKTVHSVYTSLPDELLEEIIVVDDFSTPPLKKSFLNSTFAKAHKLRVLRQKSHMGLIQAKYRGAMKAKGDIIVFFDCHVAPQSEWYQPFFDGVNANYKRIVVPIITQLNVDTWTEHSRVGGVAKCYVTFDADFKWVDDANDTQDDAPALSGGLLGMSRLWWNESGGYDEFMFGWGGENVDQSLRTWLCGGEIKVATTSYVAHMWRTDKDAKTARRYELPLAAPAYNRMRAAVAWMGPFAAKIKEEFPIGAQITDAGDLSNIHSVRDKLKCKPFAWYLHRFRHIYIEGGIVPQRTFALKHAGNGACLKYAGLPGTAKNGVGALVVDEKCAKVTDLHRFHAANRMAKPFRRQKSTIPDVDIPLSGIRVWNTDQCISMAGNGTKVQPVGTTVCDVRGSFYTQQWRFIDGKIKHVQRNVCLNVEKKKKKMRLVESTCSAESNWEIFESVVPREWKYLQQAKLDNPELFTD